MVPTHNLPSTPAGTRFAAGCGGMLLGMALTAGIGFPLVWLWGQRAGDAVRNDPGFAGFGVAAVMIMGFLVVAVLSFVVGCVSAAVSAVAANRLGRVPVTSMAGFPLAAVVMLWLYPYGAPKPLPVTYAPQTPFVQFPAAGSPPSAAPEVVTAPLASTPPAPVTPAPGRPADDAEVRYAAPAGKPTPEQIRAFARQAEQDAPAVLGEWLYPGARAIPFTPRPGKLAYPLLGLETTDPYDTVVAYYERLAPGGGQQGKNYVLHGKRPSDGRDTEIQVSTYRDKTFIRFDAR